MCTEKSEIKLAGGSSGSRCRNRIPVCLSLSSSLDHGIFACVGFLSAGSPMAAGNHEGCCPRAARHTALPPAGWTDPAQPGLAPVLKPE